MKVTIFGASGSVGRIVVATAVRRGYDVTAVGRRAPAFDGVVKALAVDYDDPSSLDAALVGRDAALISLGDHGVAPATEQILAAMGRQVIPRVELLTGFATSPAGRRQLGPAMRLVTTLMIPMYGDKPRQNRAVEASGLAYTIVQPPTLTDGAPTGRYRHGAYRGKSILGHISRSDLADFMLDNLEQGRYIGETVFIQE